MSDLIVPAQLGIVCYLGGLTRIMDQLALQAANDLPASVSVCLCPSCVVNGLTPTKSTKNLAAFLLAYTTIAHTAFLLLCLLPPPARPPARASASRVACVPAGPLPSMPPPLAQRLSSALARGTPCQQFPSDQI